MTDCSRSLGVAMPLAKYYLIVAVIILSLITTIVVVTLMFVAVHRYRRKHNQPPLCVWCTNVNMRRVHIVDSMKTNESGMVAPATIRVGGREIREIPSVQL
jgi:hypothetical protein